MDAMEDDEMNMLEDDESSVSQILIDGKLRYETNMECNRDFLSIFSLYGSRINYAFQTTFQDHNYCFTDYSCCSNEHFENLMSIFAKRINKLRSSFKPFIQLLSFFRGNSIRLYIHQNLSNENCINILRDNRPNGLNFEDEEVFEEEYDEEEEKT